ncbi:MAG: putative Phosphotyrosyl phosphatase activator, partial [Streblomastix strix]
SERSIRAVIAGKNIRFVLDLKPNWCDSFGNRVRIDYGTGHEAAFASFCAGLDNLFTYTDADYTAFGLIVFVRHIFYINIFLYFVSLSLLIDILLLQGGTHGVWGLDDYQFLPFLLGASQLIGTDISTKDSVLKPNLVSSLAPEYMYHEAIQYVFQMKSGPFYEHSPTLYSLTQDVKTWEKINMGMIKMYKAECLGKFPIMQHFFFGELLPFRPVNQQEEEREQEIEKIRERIQNGEIIQEQEDGEPFRQENEQDKKEGQQGSDDPQQLKLEDIMNHEPYSHQGSSSSSQPNQKQHSLFSQSSVTTTYVRQTPKQNGFNFPPPIVPNSGGPAPSSGLRQELQRRQHAMEDEEQKQRIQRIQQIEENEKKDQIDAEGKESNKKMDNDS